jgi:hypothetical protein
MNVSITDIMVDDDYEVHYQEHKRQRGERIKANHSPTFPRVLSRPTAKPWISARSK